MINRRWLVTLLLVLAAACGPQPTPTSVPPTPTIDSAAATIQAAVRLTATALAVNAAHPATPTLQPFPPTTTAPPVSVGDTPLPAITPSPIPTAATGLQEAIRILSPATGSSVTSPVIISGVADGTFEQTLVVRITDESGSVLTTVPTVIAAELGQRGPFEAEVPFSVPHDQPGRLSVFAASARDGGLTHLASAEVTLLASGTAHILAAEPRGEVHVIESPAFLSSIQSGAVHITGFSEYVFENNLLVVLCGEGGSGEPDPLCGTKDNILAAGFTTVRSPDIGQPGPFKADLTFTLTRAMAGRIAVYSASPRDGGILHLTSQEVRLEP